ncbi:sporulation histidine kinase inhibitor Sda [Bacillus sonorensis]|uniref:sporulation histidine kinase inhibitor Sda n=1 Tax=Bacillus sonorensis TaxID=119858 RepID=UPI0009E07EE2|nr:sporulation histidine kinase inhibitor Sda [Bacillus sonorensis]MCF7617688.1 sporulation histidine kinase inhibitor Sda [Bacillus sonorensis]MCY7856406.1 sporulation histidine kinase inhibitor Sda [Bacillus sonorensis]MCY8025886.1 sporulation histidine kinase inhibitor Sda [Bacillus sonorensis]MCY8088081.1 sporulation histidine kinase inhibitor Sda [Bacillus sonorensis]MCY8269496.1 sporulation histidine kinase inhibitor Sda [Bacillus sonorensis]
MKRLSDKELVNTYLSAKKLPNIDPYFIAQLETELKRRSINIDEINELKKEC